MTDSSHPYRDPGEPDLPCSPEFYSRLLSKYAGETHKLVDWIRQIQLAGHPHLIGTQSPNRFTSHTGAIVERQFFHLFHFDKGLVTIAELLIRMESDWAPRKAYRLYLHRVEDNNTVMEHNSAFLEYPVILRIDLNQIVLQHTNIFMSRKDLPQAELLADAILEI